jgi:hypothetical protein
MTGSKNNPPGRWRLASAITMALIVVVGGVAVSSVAQAGASAGRRAATVPHNGGRGTGEYPPTGVTVQTIVNTTTCHGMKIGPQCEPSTAPLGSVNVVILDSSIEGTTRTLTSPHIVLHNSDVALWSCSADDTCISPLNVYLKQKVTSGELALIEQPNSYGSSCPSTDYSQTPACPPATTDTETDLGQLAPEFGWDKSPAALYQPWSIIYTPTCPNCQVALNQDQTLGRPAATSDSPAGDLSGLFQVDQDLDLVYASSDFVPFDTLLSKAGTNTNEMVFDGKVMGKATVASGQSGFMVTVLNRSDLSLHSFNNFTTNGNSNLQVDIFSQALMAALLMEDASSNYLVAIQSFGKPAPIPAMISCTATGCTQVGEASCTGVSDCYLYDPAWARLGEAIHALGGTMAEFDALNDRLTLSLSKPFNCSGGTLQGCLDNVIPTTGDESGPAIVCGGYAFVGGTGVPNSYEVFGNKVEGVTGDCPNASNPAGTLRGPSARVQGVLTRDPSTGLFEPFLASALEGGTGSTNGLDTTLFTEAYPAPGKPTTPFPTYTGGKETAFKTLVYAINSHGRDRVAGTLRPTYWQDTNPSDWQTNINYMKAVDCAKTKLPASDDCAAIQKQLITEMEDVKSVYGVFESSDSVLNKGTLWGELGGGVTTVLQNLQTELINETQASTHSGLIEILSILSAAFGAGAAVAAFFGPAGPAIGAGLGVVSAALGIASSIVSADSESGGSSFEGRINTTADNLTASMDDAFSGVQSTILSVGEMFTTSWGKLSYMAKVIAGQAFTHSSVVDLDKTASTIQQSMVQTIYSQLVPIVYGVGVGYDATNGYAVPATNVVGQPLLDQLPQGCWQGGGMDEGDYGTAELPTSGPVLDSPYDSSPNGTPPAATLTTLQPEASFFLVQNGGNVCGTTSGSNDAWVGPALFGPYGPNNTVTLPSGGTIPDAGFSYPGFLEHGLTNCYVKDNRNAFVLNCTGGNEAWPQLGTGSF